MKDLRRRHFREPGASIHQRWRFFSEMKDATAISPDAIAKIDETLESILGKKAWIRSNCRSVASSETELRGRCVILSPTPQVSAAVVGQSE